MKKSPFYKEADLMVRLIPEVANETCFALKGAHLALRFRSDLDEVIETNRVKYSMTEPERRLVHLKVKCKKELRRFTLIGTAY